MQVLALQQQGLTDTLVEICSQNYLIDPNYLIDSEYLIDQNYLIDLN